MLTSNAKQDHLLGIDVKAMKDFSAELLHTSELLERRCMKLKVTAWLEENV